MGKDEINKCPFQEICRLISDCLEYSGENSDKNYVTEKLYNLAVEWFKHSADRMIEEDWFRQTMAFFDCDTMSGKLLRKAVDDDLVKRFTQVRETFITILAERVDTLELEKEISGSLQRMKGSVLYTFHGLKDMKVGEQIFSETRTYVCGLPWDISLKKSEKEGSNWLSVFANCNREDTSTEWSCKAAVVFTLHDANLGGEGMKLALHPATVYSPKTFSGWGFSELLNWDEAVTKGNRFISSQGSMTVQIDVECSASTPSSTTMSASSSFGDRGIVFRPRSKSIA